MRATRMRGGPVAEARHTLPLPDGNRPKTAGPVGYLEKTI
jgi:hypothetical protein